MGLRTWTKDEIRQTDATTAKNFLADKELKELNRLTVILLDIFEDQLDIGKLTLMADAGRLLDAQLRSLSRPVLNHGGRISHIDAETHAKAEYRLFDEQRRLKKAVDYANEIAALKAAEGVLPAGKGRRTKEPK